MRESLRRLPPAYVRGSYPNRSEESLPLPPRSEEERLPFHQNERREEEDLPPYSKADPLAERSLRRSSSSAPGRQRPNNQQHWVSRLADSEDDNVGSIDRRYWVSRLEDSDDEAEVIDDQTRFRRNVIDHLWQEAQRNEEALHRTSFERRERTVEPPHEFQPDEDSYASNVETTRPLKRRRGKALCCECSKVCWAFWMFWVLVIAIPAAVAAAKTF